MAQPKKNFIIPLHIYPFDVMISIEETDEELLKRLKRFGITKEDEELFNMTDLARGRCCMLSTNQTVIRLRLQQKKVDMLGVIAHEVFHAVSFILMRLGMTLEVKVSCEAYAYLTEYLFKEIIKKIKI